MGMRGLYLEELEPGLIVDHAVRRTVGEYDNILFTSLTHNLAALHLDEEYCKNTKWGTRIVNSMFTLSLLGGIVMHETTLHTTLGSLGFEQVAFPKPVFFGDTLHFKTEVLDRRDSKSMPDAGIVRFRHTGFNQHDEIVCDCIRTGLMMKMPREAGQALL